MTGMRIPLISKRSYNFSSGSGTVIAVKAVPVLQGREGVLLIRVHSHDVAGASTLEVVARLTAPSDEEPDAAFVWDAADIAKVTISSSTNAPTLLRGDMLADFGAFLQISVVGTQSSGNCEATISAELAIKA